ncbi:MAG TPA: MFS transporter [Gemmatimonadales bacterium]|nr:MFS transporter [Gemmatimonadales bacterium]
MRSRLGTSLALDRNTSAVAGAMFLMALGEELWKRFIPKYLEAAGAPLAAIGAYGSVRDFLDGVVQYPGGWVADRYGRRTGLQIFIGLAISGYLLLWLAGSWQGAFTGVVLTMAWSSMASPTLFAVIGDTLPPERRAMGFSVQSILRRIPIAIAPVLGGLLIARYGIGRGVRLSLGITVALALLTLALVSRVRLSLPESAPTTIAGVWRALPPALRKLLLSDILVRICEALVDVFLVIYALDVVGITAPQYGLLVAIMMSTSIVAYLPAARLADRVGRKPLVIATFIAFAAFPLAVISAHSFAGLVAAFVVGGLRELGEPARKALIVDLAQPKLRARSIGLYYLVRSVSIAPAAVAGGLLWQVRPALPFLLAGGFGLLGAGAFALRVEEPAG